MFLLDSQFREPFPAQSFRYLSNGDAYSVRPEPRGKGVYWYMRKKRGGVDVNLYLGPVGSLTRELMDNAVLNVESQLSPIVPEMQGAAQ